MFSGLIIIVDLEGVEPSSKQGSHMLSTCLSLPSVFVYKQDQARPEPPTYTLVPKISFQSRNETKTISEFAAPLNQTLRNKSF